MIRGLCVLQPTACIRTCVMAQGTEVVDPDKVISVTHLFFSELNINIFEFRLICYRRGSDMEMLFNLPLLPTQGRGGWWFCITENVFVLVFAFL